MLAGKASRHAAARTSSPGRQLLPLSSPVKPAVVSASSSSSPGSRPAAAAQAPALAAGARAVRVAAAAGAASPAPAQHTAAMHWADSPLAGARYGRELDTACLAVQLASKLCRTVQAQLQRSETAGKQDDSPVTVADYGACRWCVCVCVCVCVCACERAASVCAGGWCVWARRVSKHLHRGARAGRLAARQPRCAHAPLLPCGCCCRWRSLTPRGRAGAQALVAWVLQQAGPSTKLSMLAEEDAADLV
jgi:hypothetical protein